MNIFKFGLAPALCAFALVGCGGGGGGGGGTPRATATPVPAPTAAVASNAIAFRSNGQLARINPDGSGFQVLDSARILSPTFTRDKGTIAYLRFISDTVAETVVTSATGTGTRVVQGVPADALDNEINPAGTQIALTTLIGNDEALAIVNSAGGGLRTIARAVVLRSPVWMPDGTRLIFSQFDGENAAQTGIFQINADGTNKVRLSAQENAFDFDFSPDGSTVAFTDDGGDTPVIRLMNANGSNVRALPINLPNSRIQSPSFSPDGTQIAFAAGPATDAFLNLYRVPAAGGTPTMITSTPAGSSIENDSPDWR